MRVLICDDMFPAMIETVTRMLPQDEVRVCKCADLADEAAWAEVLIPAMCRLSGELISSTPNLKLIQQFGVGLEGVDIPAASALEIPVANVPGNQVPIHAECTAEGGVFLMMACARQYHACRDGLGQGSWGRPRGAALIDKTALTIGLGAVGQALAKRLVPLGMAVSAIEPYPAKGIKDRLNLAGVYPPGEMMNLLGRADFVISTATLTPQTKGLFNARVFEAMKPTAYLINISRGPLVNEADLAAALDKGLIAGAGLDVLNSEPPTPDHPLLGRDNVVITPHTAGVTEQSFDALGRSVAENVTRLKEGRELINLAN